MGLLLEIKCNNLSIIKSLILAPLNSIASNDIYCLVEASKRVEESSQNWFYPIDFWREFDVRLRSPIYSIT